MTRNAPLKQLLQNADPAFWPALATATRDAADFEELLLLSTLRRKAHARQLPRPNLLHEKIRLALLGGSSLHPLRDLLEHLCEMEGHPCELWLGAFDNYTAEIMDDNGPLQAFAPHVILLLPSAARCRYSGALTDPRDLQQAEAQSVVRSLLDLAHRAHDQTGAEILLANFILPARHDLGAYRTRTLGSDWAFRKVVNLELGLAAPSFVHLLDLEFLAHRRGGLQARDDRAWYESKQPGSPALLLDLAREAAHLIAHLRRASKKVVVLDLDNTLWGGVVADDGIEGIEIGDTSPRGEAFKAFQKYLLALKQRGLLLAVCSKNTHAVAEQALLKHPEMVLRPADFVALKINWEPKSDNIRQLAAELNLSLDSFVFIDDNPAEIEIVRQFAPEVATILLGDDPADYVAQLEDCRLFEPRQLTGEDAARTAAYQSETQRQSLLASVADMPAYLRSLDMEAAFHEFQPLDVPRLAQLINKSNQFNLTTRRRTEAEVLTLVDNAETIAFSTRLKDRFGDHGLISIVIAQKNGALLNIDTWLMSCRVLNRQVEDAVLHELVRLARAAGCAKIHGLYLPTAKNEMVRDFYPRMGFTCTSESPTAREFELPLENFTPRPTAITIARPAYATN